MLTINESNVTIMVKNLDVSIKFYESIGLTLKNRWENHYAMVETKGVTIGLHPTEAKELSSGSVSIGFMVDSFNDAKAMLEKNQIAFGDDDGKSGHYLHFSDPDGTKLYFVEPKWK
ncbi:MAG TPA: VOC family protein [Candidatus Cloacimonadota bacterium]|nr:VOC family protein [Candidatus Cloacimonadota bacterium]